MLKILLIILIITLIITFLGFITNATSTCLLVERFLSIIQSPFKIVSDSCWIVLRKCWRFFKQALASVGISGQHWVQRVVGAILISIVALLAVAVGVLNLIITIQGIFGVESNSFLESLPISIDSLIAIELSTAGIIFGFLLLDALGITHVLKFYNKENLPPGLRYTFICIFLIGTIYTVYLFGVSGIIRIETVFFEEDMPNEQLDNFELQNESIDGDSLDHIPNIGSIDNLYPDSENSGTERYKKASSKILIGIPLISMASGILAGVALIPTLAMIITFIPFVCISLFLGIVWALCSFCSKIINKINEFLFAYTDYFSVIGESVKICVTYKALKSNQQLQSIGDLMREYDKNLSKSNENWYKYRRDETNHNSFDLSHFIVTYIAKEKNEENDKYEVN